MGHGGLNFDLNVTEVHIKTRDMESQTELLQHNIIMMGRHI